MIRESTQDLAGRSFDVKLHLIPKSRQPLCWLFESFENTMLPTTYAVVRMHQPLH